MVGKAFEQSLNLSQHEPSRQDISSTYPKVSLRLRQCRVAVCTFDGTGCLLADVLSVAGIVLGDTQQSLNRLLVYCLSVTCQNTITW